jgi:hypothetical protein
MFSGPKMVCRGALQTPFDGCFPYLRNMVWHNLAKANAMYRAAFDIDLFKLLGDENKAILLRAVEHRHDCVHRNGTDKEGKKLDVFTKNTLSKWAT